jgi:hypothetical protein
MDLLDKAKMIAMTSLSILYDRNPVPLAICALTLAIDLEQQGLGVEEELEEVDTFFLAKTKKPMRKAIRGVVIKEMNMRVGSGNLSILRSFHSHVVGKKKMTNDEIPCSDIPTWLTSVLWNHYRWPLLLRRMMLRLSMMMILVWR